MKEIEKIFFRISSMSSMKMKEKQRLNVANKLSKISRFDLKNMKILASTRDGGKSMIYSNQTLFGKIAHQ
jgi:hypothetical protein